MLVYSAGISNYSINNSLRFRSSASAYLSRTPASITNRQTWTWSGWVKRGALGTEQYIFSAGLNGSSNFTGLEFNSSNQIRLWSYTSTTDATLVTTQVFRDPSAWYHIVAVFDTTNATSSNRLRLYVNGVQVTAFGTSTYPAQNYNGYVNYTYAHAIGGFAGAVISTYVDGYLSEINFIDGQALTPSSFGQTDSTDGVWQPKPYTGTYGTNGFYLKFADTSAATAAAIGKDSSSNGNNWTPNNISLTSGVTYDGMIDSPTNAAISDTRPIGNYAVMNPLLPLAGTATYNIPLYDGNLRATSSAGNTLGTTGTIVIPSGKFYWEMTVTTISGTSTSLAIGINNVLSTDVSLGTGYGYFNNGNIRKLGVDSAYGATYTNGDVIGVAYDSSANTLTFYKNNVSQGQITSISTSYNYVPSIYYGGSSNTNTVNANFGQRPFAYTPPSGYKTLCTTNLPDSTIIQGNKYMDATLYTGAGTTQSVTNAGSFKPDWVWLKRRDGVNSHYLFDAVRGVGNYLSSDATAAEANLSTSLTSFNTNGFTLGTAGGGINVLNGTFVGWQWQAGQGTTSSNTSGSITSTVSVSATAGFSIATFTPPGSGSFTFGHGLGVAPKLVICKNRSSADNWLSWHGSLGGTQYILLNLTNAAATNATIYSASPTSTVINCGSYFSSNAGNYVCYSWAEIAGFSKFGSYTGNGSADGVFVYLGFLPKYIMIKRTDTTANWIVMDTGRGLYNASYYYLDPNLTDADSGPVAVDFLSNGFKMRLSNAPFNASGGTYIYAAFAESPFKVALAR